MTHEQLRMQMLAGVITESEYKAKLQESLWDRIKDTPKAWIAKIKGGAPAILAAALSDGGFKVGVPVYAYDGGDLKKITIKSINYNTGISDIIYEKSLDGGKTFNIDEKESLSDKLDADEEFSSLITKTPEEQKAWYDETVKSIKDNFTKKDYSYKIEDLKPDTPKEKPEWRSYKDIDEPTRPFEDEIKYSRFAKVAENKKKKSLKESMIGGIVGIGAINQIPPRAKADYETAFEHFLGGKYGLNEVEEEEGKEVEGVNENVGSTIDKILQTFEFSEKGNDDMIEFGNYLLSPEGPKNIAQSIKSKLKGEGGENYFTSKPEELDAFLSKL
jgi:hypothetical protein